MGETKVKLERIEEGEILRKLVNWFKQTQENPFVRRFNLLRRKTRKAIEQAGYGPKDVSRLIADVRCNREKI